MCSNTNVKNEQNQKYESHYKLKTQHLQIVSHSLIDKTKDKYVQNNIKINLLSLSSKYFFILTYWTREYSMT